MTLPQRPLPPQRRPVPRGFTLIEVLVSLLILSVLAATCWKGVDAITSARTIADEHLKRTLRLQSVLTQVEADLTQVVSLGVVEPLIVDSRHMRLTRRAAGGVQVVTWFLQDGQLWRWASPTTTVVGEVQKYSLSSFQLDASQPGTLKALDGVNQMQVFCYLGGNMANCQSSRVTASSLAAAAAAASAATGASGSGGTSTAGINLTAGPQPPPEAVRFQLGMGEGSGWQGTVTREIALEVQ